MKNVLKSLTIEQAMAWDAATDKWVYIDDNILAPANLRATDKTVNAVEDEFLSLIDHEVQVEIENENRANRSLSCDHYSGY